MNSLKDKRIIITGCGYKPLQHIFRSFMDNNSPTHNSIIINGEEMKMNIGTATAMILAETGATIHMVGHSEEKLQNIKNSLTYKIHNSKIEYSVVDLFDDAQIINFADCIKKDKTLYWVQSLGIGAGSYVLKDDNPYLHIRDIPSSLIEAEQKISPSTHSMMRALLPHFENQRLKKYAETRVAIISSMSAIRGYNVGGAHCSAKGGLDRYINSAMLDLYPEHIYITSVRPGAVDTGMYDNSEVQKAILEVDKTYGGNWDVGAKNYNEGWNKRITLAPPIAVGEAIKYIFTTPAHIPSINIVARGQFPNEGS